MPKTNVCLKCGGFVASDLTECPQCHGEVMDWSDWMEMRGNPKHWPKCPVCGSFYVEKSQYFSNPYDNHTFYCENCGYKF